MKSFKKIYARSLTCVLALVFIGGSFIDLVAGQATNLNTGISYTDLQVAIDNATSGNILSLSGTFTGSFQILAKSLTLQATSDAPATLDGNNTDDGNKTDRTLEIIGSSSSPSMVNLINLIIQNGWATSASNNGGNGGGILAAYTTLTITNLNINNNRANSSGGGIAALYTTLIIQSSSILNNTAPTGGGFNNLLCTTVINESLIRDNSSTDTQVGGGGILSNGNKSGFSNLVMTDTIISQNQSATIGGGLYNSLLSNATCTNCSFSSNRAVVGGGIFNAQELTFNDGIITQNSTISSDLYTPDGAGVYNSASATSAKFNNSSIKGNSTADNGNGGGVYNRAPAIFDNCTIEENSAADKGGGIYNATKADNLIIKNGTQVINNTPIKDQIYYQ